MRLEEAENQFTFEYRTAINTVGENEIVVKKRLPGTAEKLYVVFYAIDPKRVIGFNGDYGSLGEYDSLEEVKNHLIGLSFASDIDPYGWVVSTEKVNGAFLGNAPKR